jgi:NitT/TauT family transport system substrate-binding protein
MRTSTGVPSRLGWVLALVALGTLVACRSDGGSAPPASSAAPAAPSAATGASGAPASVQPLNPPVKVTVGLPLIIADAGLYIAVERGYFQEEGIEVEFWPSQSTANLIPALATNQIQFGSSSFDTTSLNAAARGVDFKLLQDKSRYRADSGTAALVARKDLYDSGAFTDIRQARGKNIAVVTRNGTPEYYLEIALKKVGMTLNDLEFQLMPITDMPAALGNKAIDGAWLYEPLMAAVEMRDLARVVIDAGEIAPDEYPQVLYVSETFVRENPEAVRRFVTAHLRGQRDYYRAFQVNETDRSEIISYLTKYTAVKDPAMYERMRFHGVEPNGVLEARPLERFQDFSIDKGLLPNRVNVASLIDPQYVEYAVQRLGKWPDPYR